MEKGNAASRHILQRIKGRMSEFSKGQKLIARYILDNYDKAAFMTASRLGKTVHVSESTVVRFASELGYDGYPSMQKALQEMIRTKLTSIQRIQAADNQFSGQDLATAVMQSDMEKLRLAIEEMDQANFDRVVDKLMNARHIYILGVRSSSFVAGYLHFYLHMLFENVTLVQSNAAGEIFEQLFRIGPGDVILAISFPRYSKKAVKTMKYASAQKATTVAITDSPLSPLAQYASHVLLARSDMVSFVDSLVGPLSILNALIVTVAIKKKNEVADTLRKIEGIWDEYSVYEKVDEKGS